MESLDLSNLELAFNFAGKEYKVKKANLNQVIAFQRRVKEITDKGDGAADILAAAYAIYLVLFAVDNSVTEEHVLNNCAGDIETTDILIELGFLSQTKAKFLRKAKEELNAAIATT